MTIKRVSISDKSRRVRTVSRVSDTIMIYFDGFKEGSNVSDKTLRGRTASRVSNKIMMYFDGFQGGSYVSGKVETITYGYRSRCSVSLCQDTGHAQI